MGFLSVAIKVARIIVPAVAAAVVLDRVTNMVVDETEKVVKNVVNDHIEKHDSKILKAIRERYRKFKNEHPTAAYWTRWMCVTVLYWTTCSYTGGWFGRVLNHNDTLLFVTRALLLGASSKRTVIFALDLLAEFALFTGLAAVGVNYVVSKIFNKAASHQTPGDFLEENGITYKVCCKTLIPYLAILLVYYVLHISHGGFACWLSNSTTPVRVQIL